LTMTISNERLDGFAYTMLQRENELVYVLMIQLWLASTPLDLRLRRTEKNHRQHHKMKSEEKAKTCIEVQRTMKRESERERERQPTTRRRTNCAALSLVVSAALTCRGKNN